MNTIQQMEELKGEILMDKPQLMEYLKAVCDGEAALYACNETTDALRRQLNAIPEELRKPAMCYQKPAKKNSNSGCVLHVIASVMGLLTSGFLGGACGYSELFSLGGGFAVFLLTLLLPAGMKEMGYRQECEAAKDAAQSQYENEMQEYNQEIKDIKFREEKNRIIREELRTVIAENERIGERIREELKRLYDRNIVHEKFRSVVAVTQIYEYLNVGMCNSLEGDHGAYAMYSNGIRTDKLCDGIRELKSAIERGVSRIAASQSTMCQLLSDTNNSIRQMDTSLQAKIAALQGDVGRVSDGVSGLRDSVLDSADAANKQREEIRGILSTAAHNQYVEQREKGMSTWLLRNP